AYPQQLELPEAAGGFGLSLFAASLIIMPSGLLMMILSPVAGRMARTIGARTLLIIGAAALVAAYAFTLVFSDAVWHLLVANLLIGVGIGFGYASMPMLIMRSVPPQETGASNGLNALFRSLGTSTAAAAIGAVLAGHSRVVDGMPMPTPQGFDLSYVLGIAGALVALGIASFIPKRPAPGIRHPSLPQP